MAKPTTTKARSGNAPTAWQIKGVTPETRAAVKAAARRAGTTIGAWTNEALHRAATAELTGDAGLPAPRIDEQLAAIEAPPGRPVEAVLAAPVSLLSLLVAGSSGSAFASSSYVSNRPRLPVKHLGGGAAPASSTPARLRNTRRASTR